MFFDFLRRPREDVRIDLPGIQIAFNHRLKVAMLFTYDPKTKDDAFADLEKHLNGRGYILQVIIAPEGLPMLDMETDERA